MTVPISLTTRLRRNVNELGWGGTLLRACDGALRRLSAGRVRLVVYALTVQPVGARAWPPVRPGGTTSVELLTGQTPNFEDDPRLAGIPRSREVLAARLRAGTECLLARLQGTYAGMHWIARGQYVEDEVRCQYRLADPVRMVWDFDVHVDSALRGSRVFARLWQAADTQLAAQGVHWTCSRISALNAASLAAHIRLGARVVGRVAFLVAGRWQLCVRAWPPYIHVAGPASTGPTLLMHLPAPAPSPSPAAKAAPVQGTPRNPAALVLGLDSHGLAVARALADAGVTVYGLKRDLGLPGAKTNRVRGIFLVEDFTAGHLVPALKRVRAELAAHDSVVLLANNDRQVEAIALHLPELLPLYRIAWADQTPLILQLQQKHELEAVSLRQGLRYPRSVLFEDADPSRWPAAAHALSQPVILKPVRPLSSFKTLLLQHFDELGPALQQYAHDLPILGQEYIAGGDEAIYFGALMLDRGQVLHGMAGRKIASHPPARGQTTIAETVDAPEVLRLTEQFFAGMDLSGPVSLELKRDPAGHHWVIEPTVARTDFWALLCIGAGFNQPLMEYQLALGLRATPAGPPRHCVWYDTERDPLAWLRLCWQERTLRPRGGRQLFTYWQRDDARPTCRALGRLLSRQAVQWISRWKLGRRPSGI